MISMEIGALLGAPTAGWLYDGTLEYEYSFYIAGASFMISVSVMCVPKVMK